MMHTHAQASTGTQPTPLPSQLPDEFDVDMDISGVSEISLGDVHVSPLSVHSLQPTDVESPVSPPFSPVTPDQDGPAHLCPTSTPLHTLPCKSTVTQEQPTSSFSSRWHGFKFVGDNVDKNVKPRNQTLDRQGRSLHYYHHFAVEDRIDFSSESEEPPSEAISLSMDDVLPTEDDYTTILSNFAVLVCRVICENMPGFSEFQQLVKQHIEHEHQKEMSQRSKVVRCVLADTLVMHCA